MTKVIKGEFKKIKDVKVEDVSLTFDTPLEIFNMEVSRLSGMDNDLFTYEVEVANIPCNSKMDDDSEDEADDDMGYDPSDIRGDDEVELTDEESSDDEDEIAEVFRIDTNIFDYETPLCSAFNEFNYLLKVDPDLLTKDIMGFKTYEDYKDDWIYEWNKEWPTCKWKNDGYCNGGNLPETYIIGNQLHYQDLKWYEALEDCEVKDEALRKKAIGDGFINDDDESRCELKRRWNIYTNYDDAYEINHEDNESKELCEVHELSVCNVRKYMMIKYSFNNNEVYVVVKEDEYDDLTITRKEACQAYQEIFRIMDKGWMVTRTTLKKAKEKSNLNTSLYQDRNAPIFPIFYTGPRERNIDEVGEMHIFMEFYVYVVRARIQTLFSTQYTALTPTNSSSQATNFPNTSQDADELETQQQHVQQQNNQAPLQPETVADNVPNAMFDGIYSKRHAFWSLNEDILKINILKTNTPNPSRKIRRIRARTQQRPQRNKVQYAVSRGLNTLYSRYGINIIF
ncbi:hypothetical protein Tco_0604180 [Tanacetum coccineum]